MKITNFRRAGWLICGICLVLSIVLIANRHHAFRQVYRLDGRDDMNITKARLEADLVAKAKPPKQYACADRNTHEETAFLVGLRRLANSAGVTIARMESHDSTYGEAEKAKSGPPPADAPADPKDSLKGITKIGCDLTLSGSYRSIRRFLDGVWGSDRLYVLSGIVWNRSETGSQLVLTLNRYIAPASPVKP